VRRRQAVVDPAAIAACGDVAQCRRQAKWLETRPAGCRSARPAPRRVVPLRAAAQDEDTGGVARPRRNEPAWRLDHGRGPLLGCASGIGFLSSYSVIRISSDMWDAVNIVGVTVDTRTLGMRVAPIPSRTARRHAAVMTTAHSRVRRDVVKACATSPTSGSSTGRSELC